MFPGFAALLSVKQDKVEWDAIDLTCLVARKDIDVRNSVDIGKEFVDPIVSTAGGDRDIPGIFENIRYSIRQ